MNGRLRLGLRLGLGPMAALARACPGDLRSAAARAVSPKSGRVPRGMHFVCGQTRQRLRPLREKSCGEVAEVPAGSVPVGRWNYIAFSWRRTLVAASPRHRCAPREGRGTRGQGRGAKQLAWRGGGPGCRRRCSARRRARRLRIVSVAVTPPWSSTRVVTTVRLTSLDLGAGHRRRTLYGRPTPRLRARAGSSGHGACLRAPMIARIVVSASFALLSAACAASPAAVDAPPPSASHGQAHAPHAPDGRPDCQTIATTCHDHDEHGGLMRECHLMGHDPQSTNEICAARKDQCLAACRGPAH